MSNEEITIRRGKYRKNYTVFPNDLCQNRTISYEAKGLLMDLLSRPENWIVHINTLIIPGHCGRDKVKRMIKELVQAGFIEDRIRLQDEKTGKFSYTPYIVNDTPIEPLTEKPLTGLPLTGEPSTANPHLQSTDRESKEIESTYSSAGADTSSIVATDTTDESISANEPITLAMYFANNGGQTASAADLAELHKLEEIHGYELTCAAIDALAYTQRFTVGALKSKVGLMEKELLKPYIDALHKHRPMDAINKRGDDYVDAARECAKYKLCIDDIPALWQFVKAKSIEGKWSEYGVGAVGSRVGPFIASRAKRARAQEQRAAAPDEPIDYDAMLSASLDRASLYEATGD